jgi:hypothetical protein
VKAPAALASTPKRKSKDSPPASAPEAAAWLIAPDAVKVRRVSLAERLAAEPQYKGDNDDELG